MCISENNACVELVSDKSLDGNRFCTLLIVDSIIAFSWSYAFRKGITELSISILQSLREVSMIKNNHKPIIHECFLICYYVIIMGSVLSRLRSKSCVFSLYYVLYHYNVGIFHKPPCLSLKCTYFVLTFDNGKWVQDILINPDIITASWLKVGTPS